MNTKNDTRSRGSACGILASGDSLDQGQSLPSCHADYHLDMQGDGNLVLYLGQPVPSNALWATNTAANEGPVPGYKVTMQSDGDFVLFDDSGHPIMHTNTSAPSNAIWATGTNQ